MSKQYLNTNLDKIKCELCGEIVERYKTNQNKGKTLCMSCWKDMVSYK